METAIQMAHSGDRVFVSEYANRVGAPLVAVSHQRPCSDGSFVRIHRVSLNHDEARELGHVLLRTIGDEREPSDAMDEGKEAQPDATAAEDPSAGSPAEEV